MTDLTLICQQCSQQITGDSGCLRVSHAGLAAYRDAEAEWRKEHPGDCHELTELLTFPDEVGWVAWHDRCRPDEFDDGYEIASGELQTWAGLAHWTAHLLSKTWLPSTDWDDVLREAAGDMTPTRIRAVRSKAA